MDRRNLREGLRGLESKTTRAIDVWHLKILGELMQVIVKSQWHLKDYDSKEVVQNINFNHIKHTTIKWL